MKTMFVIPRPGLKVVDPLDFSVLPPEGRRVPNNVYWNRRLDEDSVYLKQEEANGGDCE